MPDREATLGDLLLAVQDQTRVFLALSEKYPTKAERVRKLGELMIPPSRIALLLGMPLRDVTSALSKARKRGAGNSAAGENPSASAGGNDEAR
jgi:hypothetical protein